MKAPIDIWCGKAADYSNLRLYESGCATYALDGNEDLESRAIECVSWELLRCCSTTMTLAD